VQDGSVLMFGVTLNTYTLFHTAEDAAGVPYLYERTPCLLEAVDRAGQILRITMRRHDMRIVRCFSQMDEWLEQRGLLMRHSLGLGQLLFIPHAGTTHRQLVDALGLRPHVHFEGLASPSQVAARMRQSALLVVPSRRESFSAVAAEALACGTPVVATRCGGPEDIVTADTGRLVAVDDPEALARGIDDVLAARSSFDPEALRRSAVSRFGRAAALARLRELYERGLASRGPRAAGRAVP